MQGTAKAAIGREAPKVELVMNGAKYKAPAYLNKEAAIGNIDKFERMAMFMKGRIQPQF